MDNKKIIILLLFTLSFKSNARYKVKDQVTTLDNQTKTVHKYYDEEIHINEHKTENSDKGLRQNNEESNVKEEINDKFESNDKEFSHYNEETHSTNIKKVKNKIHDKNNAERHVNVDKIDSIRSHGKKLSNKNMKNIVQALFNGACRPGTERDYRGWCVEEKCIDGYVRFNGLCVETDDWNY